MGNKVVFTVCGRAGSKGFKNKNLKVFCGKPLVHYTLSAVELFMQQRPDLEAKVVLNTDSEALRDLVLDTYPETVFIPRPEELCGDRVPKLAVFQHSLSVMEQQHGPIDYLMDLDITSPLRRVEDVKGCFEGLEKREELELVMSAVKSRRSPYMNMALRVDDHVEQVIRTDFVARQQTPQCYDLNASLYAFRREFLTGNETGRIWDARCDVYEMVDPGVLDIDSEEDFELMELIGERLFKNQPEFGQVRDHIRD